MNCSLSPSILTNTTLLHTFLLWYSTLFQCFPVLYTNKTTVAEWIGFCTKSHHLSKATLSRKTYLQIFPHLCMSTVKKCENFYMCLIHIMCASVLKIHVQTLQPLNKMFNVYRMVWNALTKFRFAITFTKNYFDKTRFEPWGSYKRNYNIFKLNELNQ